ncbi:MAG: GNAT family N-acetyltransferase [Nocardioides sp.]
MRRSLSAWQTWVVRSHGRLIGAVRGRLDAETWEIGRLMVAPDLQGRGLGRRLLEHIQAVADPAATSFRLAVGAGSTDDLRMYRRAGFRVGRPRDAMVWVTKPR